MKYWTKEGVEKHLENFDREAAKKWTYAFNYYLDENNEFKEIEIAVFIVMEWLVPEKTTTSRALPFAEQSVCNGSGMV